ncbi:MAG: glycosyltransferase [Candidatus Symbiothrix sp.]|jgi:glycosyltransferase involved in cell wall biosynthesis|nr:glycosyltransferase [Candidatus Symbiothrix sp.]
MQISIIVAVYNEEKLLSRCLDSILAQTFTDFEVLLVNDGSTDNSGNICDKYAQKDARIRVFHKENGGVSSARNIGITHAKGTYSIHVDSDDWIEPNMLAEMYDKITSSKSDILIADYYSTNALGKNIYESQNMILQDVDNLIIALFKNQLKGYLWIKLIRHELYSKHNISFPTHIKRGEDCIVFVELLLNQPKLVFLARAYYHYIYNAHSITKAQSKSRYYEQVDFFEELKSVLEKYNVGAKFDDMFIYYKTAAKLEMLYSGLLSQDEYDAILPITLNRSLIPFVGLMRYLLLHLAQMGFYKSAHKLICFFPKLKTFIYHLKQAFVLFFNKFFISSSK